MTFIDRPVIVVGTGRCGSTMLHRLLARHPELGWLSTFNEVFPTQSWLSAFSGLYRSRMFSDSFKHRTFFPKPFEAYKFFEHYLPGFSRRDRPQTAEDVVESGIEPVRTRLAKILRYQGKSRLLIKVTGWSRIEYFQRIFPDAMFVWLKREHRSVLSSWVQAGWLDVTTGLDSPRWQWGQVPAAYREAWEDLGGGPLLSAAVKIQLDLDDIRRNMAKFPDSSYELEYEDLIADPLGELKGITDFCGLGWPSSFEQEMAALPFHDRRDKWKKYLTEEQGEQILEFFARARGQRPEIDRALVSAT